MSVAKLKARSKASRQNKIKFYFWREATLCPFSFASLSHFQQSSSEHLIGHFSRKG